MEATMGGQGQRAGSADQSPTNFAALLKLSRVDAHLAQEELAARAGLSVRSVRDIERGRVRYPRPETARLLGIALGLSGVELAEFVSRARADYWTGRSQPPRRKIENASRITGAGAPGGPTADGDPTRTSMLWPTPPAQLPADVPVFTGRRRESRTLDGLLNQGQARSARVAIQVLSGMAGVGKTTLAVHWAHSVAAQFPDGQLYANLRGFDPSGQLVTPAEAIRGFLHALGVPPERIPPGLDGQAGQYRSLLAGKRVLVLLDNARDAEQVRPLLPGTPTALTLVTSRNQFTPLVAAYGAQHLTVDVLTYDEARELLAQRLGTGRVAAEPRPVRQIITASARLPLALAIAAARAQQTSFTLSALAAELAEVDTRLDVLDTGDPTCQVRTVFSWSYTALTSPAARLFRLLCLHVGRDLSTAAAASLIAECIPQAKALLNELTRANLLTEHTPGRYIFHDLLRAYAIDLAHTHDPDHTRHTAMTRLLDHYLHTAHAADRLLHPARDPSPMPPGPPAPGTIPERPTDHGQAMAWLTTTHSVLLATLHHAADAGFDTHTWQLAWALDTFLYRQGHWHDRVTVWQAALPAAQRFDDLPTQAFAHRLLAHANTRLGRHSDAHPRLRQALDLYTQAGDRIGQAHTHYNLAYLRERQGHLDKALDHAQQALTLFHAAGHRRGQAVALNTVGWYHSLLGDHFQALTYCEQALTLFQQLGYREGEAPTWDSLGHAHHYLGHYSQAIDCYQHALTLFAILDDRYQQAVTLTRLGDTHHNASTPIAARTAWTQALTILTDLDHPDAQNVQIKLHNLDQRPTPRPTPHPTD